MIEVSRPNWPRFSEQKAAADPRVPVNTHALFTMGTDAFYEYRGQALRIPPVPAVAGAELFRAVAALRVIGEGAGDVDEIVDRFIEATREIERRCTALIRPLRLRDKIARRFGKWRPLRDASNDELRELSDFLLRRRVMSNTQSQMLN